MKNGIILILVIFSFTKSYCQGGYSSASLSMNRANGIVSPEEVCIEEYMNYHIHQIPIPDTGEEIRMSACGTINSDNKSIFQIGIASEKYSEPAKTNPVNICLVIDISGSMQAENRLEKVKSALLKFVKGLRPDDIISIVTYDNVAETVLSPQKMKDISNIEAVINSLKTKGSTNLEGGLMQGYEQVLKNFRKEYTNKVILLTDGNANVGITDPQTIAGNSFNYNQKGIDVSTIGVGFDINHELLRKISDKGRGSNYFIGTSQEDIDKTFKEELESLMFSVARNVLLTIEIPDNIKVLKVYGYETVITGNKIVIPLKNINSGLTQIVLLECEVDYNNQIDFVKAELSYFSNKTQADKKLELSAGAQNFGANSPTCDTEKNYCIAVMASNLKDAAERIFNNKTDEAIKLLQLSLTSVNVQYPGLTDTDIIRVRDILTENLERMKSITASIH